MFSWHPLKSIDPSKFPKGFKYLESSRFDDQYKFEYLEKCITKYVWSPMLFRSGIRNEEHFKAVLVCGLDFDSPSTTLSWALETFKEYAHIIGTTKSHQREKKGVVCDRFRVVLLFQEIITDLNLYKYNIALLTDKYKADKACKDGARFFFPCKEIVSRGNGRFVDIKTPDVAPQRKIERCTGRGLKSFVKVQPATENRNQTVFRLGCKLFRTNMNRNEIINTLCIAANGLPEGEFQRTVERAEAYAKK